MAKKNKSSSGEGLVKRATETALTDWEQQEASHARDVRSKLTLGIPRITTRGGVFKIDDKVVGNVLKLAIVATKKEKSYYKGKFDPTKPATPDCYAFGDEEATMVANDASRDKQNLKEDGSSPCVGCRWNAFRTAEVGSGKRCKDYTRLLVIAPTLKANGEGGVMLDPDRVQKADVRLLQVPPASLTNWGNYVKSLTPVEEGGLGLTRTGSVSERIVITTIYPLENGGHGLKFEADMQLPADAHRAITLRRKAAESMLTQPYPDIEAEPQETEEQVQRKGAIKKKLK